MSDAHPTVLAFTSANGGTGQTSIATHVALGLARVGRQVLLVETQHPSIASHYLSHAVARQSATPLALGSLSGDARYVEENLWYASLDSSSPDRLAELTDWSRRGASRDYWLVLDLPRHLDVQLDLDMKPDIEFEVLRADPSSLIDLRRVVDRDDLQIVLNQIDARRRISQDIDRVLSTLLQDRIAARVHYDEALPEALAEQHNLYDSAPESLAARALFELVNRIVNAEQPSQAIFAAGSGD